MKQPTLCVIFEAIGSYNAIGKIAMDGVRVALDAGYKVTVVAQRLDESLHDRVEWLKLYVPPHLFYVKWVTARHFMLKALGGRTFDIVHAHQPQAAFMSDVYDCQFITRVAFERNCFEARPGLKASVMRMQEHGVLRAEDRFYKSWNPRTRMLFCSDLVRREFTRLYGAPPRHEVLYNVMPPMRIPSAEERREARIRFIGHDHSGPVLGYIGGVNERKGYRPLIEGLKGKPTDSDVFFLMGGNETAGYEIPALEGRYKTVGLVQDTAAFYAACDVFAVPSYFDPCPLVVFEAAARGLPVIATEGVGNLHALTTHSAGVEWTPGEPLTPVVHALVNDRERYQEGARSMAEAYSYERNEKRLLEIYEDVLREKREGNPV